MPFLNLKAEQTVVYEWGFDVPAWAVPSVGDKVHLWHAPPDEEPCDFVVGEITKRVWQFTDDYLKRDEIAFEVELETQIPKGDVADSTEWPAMRWSERYREFQKELDAIRNGENQ